MNVDFLKKHREERAINASIRYGGKFFCWHDFTSLGKIGMDSNQIPFMCVKCGLSRNFTHSQAAGYVENVLN